MLALAAEITVEKLSISVIAVMFSTMLTMIDACPRAVSALLNYRVRDEPAENPDSLQQHLVETTVHEDRYYLPLVIAQCVGATLVLVFFPAGCRHIVSSTNFSLWTAIKNQLPLSDIKWLRVSIVVEFTICSFLDCAGGLAYFWRLPL